MEIKDFVRTTLRELFEAISESEAEIKKKVKLTNVPLRVKGAGNYGLIDFDLAVEAKSAQAGGGKGGVRIAVVEASIGGEKTHASSSASRVKFTVEADF